jgi:hypothetical protein
MRDVYRTMDPITREKTMRRITTEEKKEKSTSIECFRGVQFVSFIACCLTLSFTSYGIITNAFVQYSWAPILSVGSLLFGLFATMKLRSLREIENLYWEQQSANENVK